MRRTAAPGRLLLLTVALMICLPAASARAVGQYIYYLSPDGRELRLVFDEGIGLSGQAILRLLADNRSIEIHLTNTSTAIPDVPDFDNPSDQLLTTLYFDLGGPGLSAGDPLITGGGAWVGEGSTGVGKGNPYDEGDDLSTLWGYGNFKYDGPQEFLPPNFVGTMRAQTTAFAFSMSVEGDLLKGPDYGAISSLNLLNGHEAGLPSISDTVQIVIYLDQELTTLASIVAPQNDMPYIEFGSDSWFVPPLVPEPLTGVGMLLGITGLAAYLRRRRA